MVMKLEDVTQTNEEIDEAVHRSASAYRGAGSRRFSYFTFKFEEKEVESKFNHQEFTKTEIEKIFV